jgi:hypothetical protein
LFNEKFAGEIISLKMSICISGKKPIRDDLVIPPPGSCDGGIQSKEVTIEKLIGGKTMASSETRNLSSIVNT